MGTVYFRTNPFPARIGTTKLITIPTTPVTVVVMDSGYMGMHVTNIGPSLSIAWGDTNLTISSGGLLYYSMAKEWLVVSDSFALFFIADSVAGRIAVNEYI